MMYPGVADMIANYQSLAQDAGADPLGYYVAPQAYAQMQIVEQAIAGTGSLDDAKQGREVLMPFSFTVNGKLANIDAAPDTPLLWVVREHLKLTGTKYGCGAGMCGACTVHLDGRAVRSCQTPIAAVTGKRVTTIEGLSANGDHPLQKAWVDLQVPQCGYCQSGQIMQAAALLASKKNPSRDDIIRHMDGNICRCGTYPRILRAVERAAKQGA